MCKICLNPEHRDAAAAISALEKEIRELKEKPVVLPTIEDLIKAKSQGMNDAQKSACAKEIDALNYKYNLYVPVKIVEISASDWKRTAQEKYPSLVSVDAENEAFTTCAEAELQRILSLDWTNLVEYSKFFNCDNFAELLASRLNVEYGISSAIEVWGWADKTYHGFNLVVFKKGDGWEAKLIEPQTDAIFDYVGPCGTYTPEKTK